MDEVLQQLVEKIDQYVGSLIDTAAMPPEDKDALKFHLLEAQKILVRNGSDKLEQLVSGISKAILSRF